MGGSRNIQHIAQTESCLQEIDIDIQGIQLLEFRTGHVHMHIQTGFQGAQPRIFDSQFEGLQVQSVKGQPRAALRVYGTLTVKPLRQIVYTYALQCIYLPDAHALP